MSESAANELIHNGQLEDNPWRLYQPDPSSGFALPPDAPAPAPNRPETKNSTTLLRERWTSI